MKLNMNNLGKIAQKVKTNNWLLVANWRLKKLFSVN